MAQHPFGPVVALDIDGTLGRYHDHFTAFAGPYVGRDLVADWRDEYQGRFNKALGLSKKMYRQVKLSYRQGGLKRSMPVFPGARELTVKLRKQGVQVWICTTRPYMRLDNIDPDTRHMLRRHGIQYDGVLYGERKYSDLVKIVGRDRIIAVLDDLPEQIEAANKLGLPTILRAGEHNAWWDNPEQHWVSHLGMAREDLLEMSQQWKKEHNGKLQS